MNLLWLLLGPGDFRRGRWLLRGLGLTLVATGLLVGLDAPRTVTELLLLGLGYIVVAMGLVRLAFAAAGVGGGLISGFAARGLALVLLGLAVAAFPDASDHVVPWLVGAAFIVQGLYQIGSALVIRYPRWGWFLASGAAHVLGGGLMFVFWRQAMSLVLPSLLAAGLLVLGISALHLASRLARFRAPLDGDDPAGRVRYYLAFHLPRRFRRAEYAGPVAPPTVGTPHGDLLVHIWTPTAVARSPVKDPNLLNRYFVDKDPDGKITVGHAALSLDPDVYISHCDGDPNGYDNGDEAWRELRSRDVGGEFLPSFEEEVSHYLEPSVTVRFRAFREDQLRTFWHMYRQVTTYNLTNRNCSVAVALALEAALLGTRSAQGMVRGTLGLLFNRDLWLAHFLRWKAMEMVWTPGMMLDYAMVLHRLAEE